MDLNMKEEEESRSIVVKGYPTSWAAVATETALSNIRLLCKSRQPTQHLTFVYVQTIVSS